jgi:transcriptional regulator GlxA family with amidase domain
MVVAPHRDGGQAQWLERPVPLPDRGLAPTCEWALRHLADPLTAARVHEARRLLEVSDLPVEEIARRSGLGSPANLRVHLARDAGTTPTAYRAAYQGHKPNS